MLDLDGLSTWPMHKEAKDVLLESLAQPGNANPNHVAGWHANSLYEDGKRAVADLIGTTPTEIFVTSGAAESDALVISAGVFQHPLNPGSGSISVPVLIAAMHLDY